MEDCGFAKRGTGVQLGCEGAIRIGGTTPLATRGGSKARGDTVGANGIYQMIDLVLQSSRSQSCSSRLPVMSSRPLHSGAGETRRGAADYRTARRLRCRTGGDRYAG